MRGNARTKARDTDTPSFESRRKYNKEEFRRRLRGYEETWVKHLESLSDERRRIGVEQWIQLKEATESTIEDSG